MLDRRCGWTSEAVWLHHQPFWIWKVGLFGRSVLAAESLGRVCVLCDCRHHVDLRKQAVPTTVTVLGPLCRRNANTGLIYLIIYQKPHLDQLNLYISVMSGDQSIFELITGFELHLFNRILSSYLLIIHELIIFYGNKLRQTSCCYVVVCT